MDHNVLSGHQYQTFKPCILGGVDLGDSQASCRFSSQSVLCFFHAGIPFQMPHPLQSKDVCACLDS
jgi:hypothetical protein